MRLGRLFWGAFTLGAGALLYGALFETERLKLERRTLRLRRWPAKLDGYRVAVLADPHIRDERSIALCRRAVAMALDEGPDIVVLPGDLIAYWKRGVLDMVREALGELAAFRGPVLAVPGNHDYAAGDAAWLGPALEDLHVRWLRNESVILDGVNWVGVDSELAKQADPYAAIMQTDATLPIVVVWHEPDMVDTLPWGPELMISGHSHGGQFTTPWGWAPGTSELGRKYLRGFFPDAPVPLYVSRGIGTTGPPSRLFCQPEVTVLTLRSAV
ncbi:MAG: metallophosphoesterase [Armatimonadetes bacterium]|nr:metallophosphoesterase [Armatimonadota bacterium]